MTDVEANSRRSSVWSRWTFSPQRNTDVKQGLDLFCKACLYPPTSSRTLLFLVFEQPKKLMCHTGVDTTICSLFQMGEILQ